MSQDGKERRRRGIINAVATKYNVLIDPGPPVYNPLLRIDYAHLGGRTVRRVCGRCGNVTRHYPHRVEGGAVWLCCFCGKAAELPGGR